MTTVSVDWSTFNYNKLATEMVSAAKAQGLFQAPNTGRNFNPPPTNQRQQTQQQQNQRRQNQQVATNVQNNTTQGGQGIQPITAATLATTATLDFGTQQAERYFTSMQRIYQFLKSDFLRIQDQLGMQTSALSDIRNETNKATVEEYEMLKNMNDEYLNNSNNLRVLMPQQAQFVNRLMTLQENVYAKSSTLTTSFTKDMRMKTVAFQQIMNLNTDNTNKVINRTIAQHGKANVKILENATAHAKILSDRITGLHFKDVLDETMSILADTDTFGFKAEDQAARIAASFRQAKLSLNDFTNLVTGYRDFDTAASKLGDLSSMFGVQMDAMEMMYLANEDEEKFLHRFREQLIDQGVDVENMSNTRMRALSKQLGMNVNTLRNFLREGDELVDMGEMQEAQMDKSEEYLKKIAEVIQGFKLPEPISQQDAIATHDQRQIRAAREGYQKAIVEGDKFQTKLLEIKTTHDDVAKSVSKAYSGIASNIKKATSGLDVAISKEIFTKGLSQENLEEVVKVLKPFSDQVFSTITKAAEDQGVVLEEHMTPGSLPPFLGGNNASKGMNLLVSPPALKAYTAIGSKVAETLASSIQKKFDKSLSLSLDVKPSIISKLNNIKFPPVKVDLQFPKDPVEVKHVVEKRIIQVQQEATDMQALQNEINKSEQKRQKEIEAMVDNNVTVKDVLDDILLEVAKSKQTMVKVELDKDVLFNAIAKHSHFDGRTIVVKAGG